MWRRRRGRHGRGAGMVGHPADVGHRHRRRALASAAAEQGARDRALHRSAAAIREERRRDARGLASVTAGLVRGRAVGARAPPRGISWPDRDGERSGTVAGGHGGTCAHRLAAGHRFRARRSDRGGSCEGDRARGDRWRSARAGPHVRGGYRLRTTRPAPGDAAAHRKPAGCADDAGRGPCGATVRPRGTARAVAGRRQDR